MNTLRGPGGWRQDILRRGGSAGTQDSHGLWSENSSVWSFEVDTPPSPPTGLTVKPDGRGRLELTWNQNPEDDIAGYDVFRASVSGGSYEMISDDLVPNPSYSGTGLPDNATFYYVVTAVDLREQQSDYCTRGESTAAFRPRMNRP